VLAASLAAAAPAPPLLDRDLFFADPQISGAQLSPDGRWLSFLKPHHGVRNIWVKRLEEPFDAARPLTADSERPVRSHFWSHDGRLVLYLQDQAGNENFHVYAVDPTKPADPATGAPPARDLTPGPKVRALLYAVPESSPDSIVVGLNDRDPRLHDVYRVSLSTGERKLVIENRDNISPWIADLDGEVRLGQRQRPDGGSELLRVIDGKVGEPLYACDFEESCSVVRFHPDGKRVYLQSNRGDDVDLTRLLLLDLETGAETVVDSDPERQVDFGYAVFSERTEELVATVYVGDRIRIYPRDDRFARGLAALRAQLPDGEVAISSATDDDRLALVSLSRDVDPGTVYLYDWEAKKVEKLFSLRPELSSDQLAPMRAIRYRARDGVEIPAYLTVPAGADPRGLPTVILPHGGPWGRDFWGYDGQVQFLANRGYAVLSMNFRGSVGYGKAFLNAGNREWGTGVMQHDISDGVRWLVEQGIADPQRIGIMGGSYGGYATLAGLAFTPELYAAGVSIVGPSNIFTLLRSIPPYWAPTRRMFHLRVGDPDAAADRARLEAQSPFFHAASIKAPLLVVQGENDPRVNKAESEQIVVRLRDLGRDVEYLLAADEGHGFAGVENQLAMWAEIESFLARRLGGRFQNEMAPEIASRLEALRVDISKLEMPASAAATGGGSGGATAP
jgi:dipeptidyl aminopeptidase/acylaminoacyl peptidase